jgi:hypothetical protein
MANDVLSEKPGERTQRIAGPHIAAIIDIIARDDFNPDHATDIGNEVRAAVDDALAAVQAQPFCRLCVGQGRIYVGTEWRLCSCQPQPVSPEPKCQQCGWVNFEHEKGCSRSVSARPDVEAALRAMWDDGFQTCRSYTDNWVHCQGEQKERRVQAALASVSHLRDETCEPDVVGYREVVVRLMDADNDPLLVHGPFPECQIGHPHKGSECPVWTLPPLTREPDTAGRVELLTSVEAALVHEMNCGECGESGCGSCQCGTPAILERLRAALQRARESAPQGHQE